MLIDTHAHVNFKDFKDDADQAILRALGEGTRLIIVGSEYKTSKRAVDYANKYESGVYAAVGLHPAHLIGEKIKGDDYEFTSRDEEFNYDDYEKLARAGKTVAIGEIGLDYYHLDKSDTGAAKEKQAIIFKKQLELAASNDLPVIIHCRDAHDDMLALLKDFKGEQRARLPKDRPWGVVHCFSGNEELAWEYFSLGLIISFTGLITFNRAWDDLIRKLPLDKFMVETDCPYMAPEPLRGRRNEPSFVKYVAARIAEIKSLDEKAIAEATSNNAKKIFKI